MVSHNFLSCRPKLHPYTFRLSEDHPKQLLLVSIESGSALGITHAEKRVVEWMNGQSTLTEILERILQEKIASLAEFRQLVWDLYRYGFLETSPWEIEKEVDGWGYWGKPGLTINPFWISPILGSWEKKVGEVLTAKIFHGATFLFLLLTLFFQWNLFSQVTPLLIANSFATGLLVVGSTLLGSSFVALWFGAMVLRTAHSSPVRCGISYRYWFPLFRLDGSRLRAYSTQEAVHCAVSPLIGVLFLSCLFFWVAGWSEGARQEGSMHIAVTLLCTVFILAIPWNSTVLSRDLTLRMRDESGFDFLVHSVHRLFHFLLQPRFSGDPHEKMSLIWGAWTILGSLVFLRVVVVEILWHLPTLVTHHLQKENQNFFEAPFVLVSILGVVLLVIFISFFVWLGREILREIHNRYWPERDVLLIGFGLFIWFLFLAQYFWTLSGKSILFQQIPVALCGFILMYTAIHFWRFEGKGYEPGIHLFPLLLGLFLLVLSIGDICSPLQYLKDPNGQERLQQFSPEGFTHSLCFWFYTLLLMMWDTYWIAVLVLWFKPPFTIPFQQKPRIWRLAGVIFIDLFLIYTVSFPQEFVGYTCGFFYGVLLLFLIVGSLGQQWIRNGSTLVICIGFLTIFNGMVQPISPESVLGESLLICMGTGILLVGYVLRYSIATRSTTGIQPLFSSPSNTEPWDTTHIANEIQSAVFDLYQTVPYPPSQEEIGNDTLQDILHHVQRLIGLQNLSTALRRLARFAPWYVTQNLMNHFAGSSPLPPVSDWTSEHVELWLRKIPIFVELEKKELASLASRSHFVFCQPGDRLIRQGSWERSLYIIVQGNATVELERSLGNRVLAILYPGDFVGEIGFLCGTERTASVYTPIQSLLLCLQREEIDGSTPTVQMMIHEAEKSDSWFNAFRQTPVLNEFPPSLSTRIGLESHQVRLDPGESFRMETNDLIENVGVFLQGKGSMIMKSGSCTSLSEGDLIGWETSLADYPMPRQILAETSSLILMIQRQRFQDAFVELLTPEWIYKTIGDKTEVHEHQSPGE